jgi:hypothetical protein
MISCATVCMSRDTFKNLVCNYSVCMHIYRYSAKRLNHIIYRLHRLNAKRRVTERLASRKILTGSMEQDYTW